MHSDRLTAATSRALELASRLAAANRAPETSPEHLLWALLAEESRASAYLTELGISPEALAEQLPLEWSAPDPNGPLVSEGSGTPLTTPVSQGLQQVVDFALQRANQSGRHTQIDSEHLLWGLVRIESPAAQFLGEFGLTDAIFEARATASGEQHTDPLPVDFALQSSDAQAAVRLNTWRILDAAANRAREGLRVVEDFARFHLDDRHFTEQLKQIRHRLRDALQPLDSAGLLTARDTALDVGTTLQTAQEQQRDSAIDVAAANIKRAQEAMRTLEEFGKTLPVSPSAAVERLRYELYTLEKALLGRYAERRQLESCLVYLLVSASACPHGWEQTVRGALQGGVDVVQLREKSSPDRQIVELGRQLRSWTRDAGALYIMNDRPDLAVLTDADGVHVGQEELTVRQVRQIVGPERLVGVSTHNIVQARQAVLDGADYLGVGPVFVSATKSFHELTGVEFVRQVAAEISLPWFAIGGINAGNLPTVVEAGTGRIAVSHAVCSSAHPARVVAQLRERLFATN